MASDVFEVGVRRRAAGDYTSDLIDEVQANNALAKRDAHPLDGDEARKPTDVCSIGSITKGRNKPRTGCK